MKILAYTRHAAPTDRERQGATALAGLQGPGEHMLGFRNGQFFNARDLETCDLVVTDSETIRAAHEAAGIRVASYSPKDEPKAPPEEATAAPDYDAMVKDDLQALVDERGLTAAGTGAGGNVLKQDLIDALEADDDG